MGCYPLVFPGRTPVKQWLRGEEKVTVPSSGPLDAVDIVFGADIDYAQTKKQHTKGVVPNIFTRDVQGWPDPTLISTAYAERLNLTFRMSVKRLTRRANSFSKSLPHLRAAISLFVAH